MEEVAASPYVLVATVARDDATTTLFFGHVIDRVPLRIAEFAPRGLRQLLRSFRSEIALASQLAGASALIVNRGLFEFSNLARCAREWSIPCYYFIDDNFIVLRGESNADARQVGNYTVATVRRALEGFDGVWCATEALQSYFVSHGLHRAVEVYPPVSLSPAPSRRDIHDDLRIGFFGGAHRREPFVRTVLPALEALARRRPVTLFAAGLDIPARSANGLQVKLLPYDRRYSVAINEMARHEIDILVHPASMTDNNPFKNPHVLINARSLGAVPLFSDAPPYDAFAGQGVCELTRDTEQDWLAALLRLDDRAIRSMMMARITDYCTQHFNGDVNVRRLAALTAHAGTRSSHSVGLLRWRLARGFVTDLSRRFLEAA